MWRPEQHSDDENLRWSWLRAVEWQHWPLFLSQPIVPVLLYVYPWPWVTGIVAAISFVWWFLVASKITPPTDVDLSVYFVYLRFLTSPLMAYLLWRDDRPWIAALALLWPFVGTLLVGFVMTPLKAVLGWTQWAKAAQIGVIQRRLMFRLGYTRRNAEPVA
jgi:hypothetical protein